MWWVRIRRKLKWKHDIYYGCAKHSGSRSPHTIASVSTHLFMAVSFSRYWLFSIADTLQQTHTHTQGNRSSRFRWLSSRFDYTYTVHTACTLSSHTHTTTHTLHTGCVELLSTDALPCYFVYFGFSLSQVWKIRKVLSLCSQCHHPCSVFDFISLPIVCVEYRASLYAVLLLLNSCLFFKFFVSWFYSPWFWRP